MNQPSPQTQAATSSNQLPPTRRPQLIDSFRPRNIDGILTPQRQHKAHLQPHPLLRQPRPAMTDRPAQGASKQMPSKATAADSDSLTAASSLPPVGQGLSGNTVADKLGDTLHQTSKPALVGLAVAALLTLLSLYSLQLGELVIAVYAIVALWRRWSSRLTFMLALGTFGGIIITQIMTPDSGIADNLAVYAFLLLCVGTIGLAREVRQGNSSAKAAH